MSHKVTLGGARLGAGKKREIELHGYERSTHDLSYVMRTTQAPGTLIPIMSELALPGDTFDIDLNVEIMTHPTTGPLFGSFKSQTDVFVIPIRLYQGLLHNDKFNIGLNMASVKLPQLNFTAMWKNWTNGNGYQPDVSQTDPSSILAYLDMMGAGQTPDGTDGEVNRWFNAVPYIGYYDIYGRYYANKQEGIGVIINTQVPALVQTANALRTTTGLLIVKEPTAPVSVKLERSTAINIEYTAGAARPMPEQIVVLTNKGNIAFTDLFEKIEDINATTIKGSGIKLNTSELYARQWRYIDATDVFVKEPQLITFPLSNIDKMRESILGADTSTQPIVLQGADIAPFGNALAKNGTFYSKMTSQAGLAVKTYQSDLFNNWIKTESISGPGGINDLTKISTSGGSFTLDTLNIANKVYEMLTRVAMSGGSYRDYLQATYGHSQARWANSPVYVGGLSKEVVFQEVISNSDTTENPLGTLAGRGVMSSKHKGGRIHISIDEPSYIMAITSLTPRIDYSQGNKWDTNLKTMDDLHKPALDQIGFQDLITDQMAWWDTVVNAGTGNTGVTFKSAGKVPAWSNYMTNVNKTRGNFAKGMSESFMTLNRRYEAANVNGQIKGIKDLTTYIDPVKYNNIFAETSRDAQNFWTQIGVGIKARRKMSYKVMPNL